MDHATAPKLGTETIDPPLLVLAEDDDAFRTLLARTLRRAGYDVAERSNGVQLLRSWPVQPPRSRW